MDQPEPGCWAFRWHLESLGERGGLRLWMGFAEKIYRKPSPLHSSSIKYRGFLQIFLEFFKQLCEDLDFEIEGVREAWLKTQSYKCINTFMDILLTLTRCVVFTLRIDLKQNYWVLNQRLPETCRIRLSASMDVSSPLEVLLIWMIPKLMMKLLVTGDYFMASMNLCQSLFDLWTSMSTRWIMNFASSK